MSVLHGNNILIHEKSLFVCTLGKRKQFRGFIIGLYIQATENKRRQRRKSAPNKKKPKLPLEKRVAHVLMKGEIIDYTEPKEIDIYFAYIYKAYEHLTYLEFFLSYALFHKYFNEVLNGYLSDRKTLELLMETYIEIKEWKKILMFFMVNGMKLTIGRVYKSKFYGWGAYMNELTSHMKAIIIENIANLEFDADKSKASVYFSNTCWFACMGLTEKIKDYNQRFVFPKPQFEREDRGIKEFSVEDINIEEFSEEDIYDYAYEPEETEINETNPDEITETVYDEYGEPVINPEEELMREEEEQRQEDIKDILRHILEDIGLSLDIIYNASDKELEKIAKKIKSYIRKHQYKYTDIIERVQEILMKN